MTESTDESSENEHEENGGMPTFVTELNPITQQVGTHVLAALKNDDCVAVLTTIAAGFPTDRVVSVPLNAEQMNEVGIILHEVATEPDGPDDLPCIGFQCRLPDGEEDDT